ncbi:hypothetical protein GDO86_003686 [Hymenochirus boettgeri]|uniref:Leucine zipper protein 1 n=1 Tax=Hymenochirus boettgeri TaxID=247094 RepID=A0A8T2K7G7_9PIPI|nr:hypothetical protein GDO86_003686 [Hymenochirus boettgeri]KAG8451578.1 hypothetical protein GDO86_003686 [Hymenochirus boettgeri]KAG8451579.1 hypothetical protein GDO86_003686 [Hymenochirus boettgeri]KAG8451580.1 hypothetical protein GDO86_003686 [Hymenochirus boettgeri]
MEHSSRHLRFKLQSLGRRMDDLDEATRNLENAEEEVLDLKEKIIQTEGSNSTMLADVEALRKRVMKIEGKDEEVKKAEELCRVIKEKLENEENVTRELRSEIENLQKRMSELEKLEEAFSKSKNDCTQLCLSLNEEKNVSKKLSSELETLKTRIKELDSSENKLDKAEQFLLSELENIRSLTVCFANEKKCFLEKEKQHEKTIRELKQQIELKGRITPEDRTRNESNLLERSSDQFVERNKMRIEDSLNSKLLQGCDFIKQAEKQRSSENARNKHQEDNKIKDLSQEVERLKSQIKRFEGMEVEVKHLKEKNGELQETCFSEQKKNKQLVEELQTLRGQSSQHKEVENGVISSDEIGLHNKSRNERSNKYKGVASELPSSKYSPRDLSPKQLRKEKNRDLDHNMDSYSRRSLSNISTNSRRPLKSTLSDMSITSPRKLEDRLYLSSNFSSAKDFGILHNEIKKAKDQPSVLSRYPPAAQEQSNQKVWKSSAGKKKDKPPKLFGEDYSIKLVQAVENSKKESTSEEDDDLSKKLLVDKSGKNNSVSEVHLSDTCSLFTKLQSEPVTSVLEVASSPDKYTAKMVEVYSKTLNSDECESVLHEGSSKYLHISGKMDSILDSSDTAQSIKSHVSSKDEKDPLGNQNLNLQRVHGREMQRPLSSSKPLIPEKPNISETTDNNKWDKRNVTSKSQSKRQSSPKEKRIQEHKISQFQTDSHSQQRDSVSEKLRKTSFDNSENIDKQTHVEIRTRPHNTREALKSTVIINPVIIEKDTKESMGEYRARSISELNRTQINSVPNKVTSSITIYPSESTSSRLNLDDITRQRHTSTSNIRLPANEQPLLKNNITIPFEISINKQEMLQFVDSNNDTDNKEQSRSNNNIGLETVAWKSHDIDGNHLDSISTKLRGSYERKGFGSTEELDVLASEKDEPVDSKHRRRSAFEDEGPVKLRTRDFYSRNRSSFDNNCTASEFISKRSSSGKDNIARRNHTNESLYSSGRASWNRQSSEGDYSYSSRRRIQGTSMVEERIRHLEQ